VPNEVLNHLDQFKLALKDRAISPAFPERASVLEYALSGHRLNAEARTTAAPLYTTDLGIRLFSETSLFYKTHLRIAGLNRLNSGVLLTEMNSAPLPNFATLLDAIVLFFGDSKVAETAIRHRFDEILEHRDYRTLIQSGVIFASLRNKDATALFEQAQNKSENASDAYAAAHREAAMQLKRFSDLSAAKTILNRAKEEYLDPDSANHIAEMALYYNLYALIDLKEDNLAASVSDLQLARENVDTVLKTNKDNAPVFSRAARYCGQIVIDQAQLALREKNTKEAVSLLLNSVRFCAKISSEYLPEAMGELALTEYCAGHFHHAIQWSVRALDQFKYIGAINAIHSVRETLIASLTKIDKTEYANQLAATFSTDPLGLYIVPDVMED
jgi:tetratricopeptide (TPR) repeat protein